MGPGSRRFRLGLYVLGTAGLFVALLGFILHNSLNAERATYFILFSENVKGMVVGSKVNFQGVPIGVVSDIRFQEGKTIVELRVDPTRASIQDITTARMDRLLVTGQVTIELEGYGANGKRLPAGKFIQTKEDPLSSLKGSIPEAVDRATSALVRLDSLLARAERLLSEANLAHIASLVANLDRASTNIADGTVPAATALLQQVRSQTLPELSKMAAQAAAVASTLQDVVPEVAAFSREASALTTSLRGPSQTVLASLRQTLDDVRALARQLKLAPDSLLFGVQRPATPAGGER